VIDVNFSRLQNPPAASNRLTQHETYSINHSLELSMRTLSTQETLAVAGAHKRPHGTKPTLPTMPTTPVALPKIDFTALIAKIKAVLATLPTKPTLPTLPTMPTTGGDTGEVVSEDTGEDVTA
jgi:hypothetical protein